MQMPATLNYTINPTEIDEMRAALDELDAHIKGASEALARAKKARATFQLNTRRRRHWTDFMRPANPTAAPHRGSA